MRSAFALALASAGRRMPARDLAAPLIDLLGVILGADESVPDELIDEIALSIGAVVAAIARAERLRPRARSGRAAP